MEVQVPAQAAPCTFRLVPGKEQKQKRDSAFAEAGEGKTHRGLGRMVLVFCKQNPEMSM